jgi:hypothetical protein
MMISASIRSTSDSNSSNRFLEIRIGASSNSTSDVVELDDDWEGPMGHDGSSKATGVLVLNGDPSGRESVAMKYVL